MRFLNPKIKGHKANLIWQPLICMLLVLCSFVLLGGLTQVNVFGVIGFASIGSSSFIAFISPFSKAAQNKRMIGGYVVSAVVGLLFTYLAITLFGGLDGLDDLFPYAHDLYAALAMGLAMLIMVLLNVDHPPAVGFTLALIAKGWTVKPLMAIIFMLLVTTLLKNLLKPFLVDLR